MKFPCHNLFCFSIYRFLPLVSHSLINQPVQCYHRDLIWGKWSEKFSSWWEEKIPFNSSAAKWENSITVIGWKKSRKFHRLNFQSNFQSFFPPFSSICWIDFNNLDLTLSLSLSTSFYLFLTRNLSVTVKKNFFFLFLWMWVEKKYKSIIEMCANKSHIVSMCHVTVSAFAADNCRLIYFPFSVVSFIFQLCDFVLKIKAAASAKRSLSSFANCLCECLAGY